MTSIQKYSIGAAVAFVLFLFIVPFMIETVDTAHEAVGTRFGKPTGVVISAGLHFPVNPLVDWTHYSTEENTSTFNDVLVPAEDQQKATIDVSLRWRLLPGAAENLRAQTGDFDRSLDVHLWPAARLAFREAGRGTEQVEDFFSDATVNAYQDAALTQLHAKLKPFGFEVTEVMVRDVTLPPAITAAIEAKKEREQEVEKQRAELERVRLEADKQVALSESDLEAAANEAKAIVLRADAKAKAIRQVKAQLTADYIDMLRAEKWNGAYPTTYMGGGATPLVSIPAPR